MENKRGWKERREKNERVVPILLLKLLSFPHDFLLDGADQVSSFTTIMGRRERGKEEKRKKWNPGRQAHSCLETSPHNLYLTKVCG